MPTTPALACSVPGCRRLVPCPDHNHRALLDRRRGTRQQRGYDADWLRCRAYILSREPLCRHCKREQATDVDHIVPLRRSGARLDPDNLQPLCAACHSRKTALEDSSFTHSQSKRRPAMRNQKPPFPAPPKPAPTPAPKPEPEPDDDEPKPKA